MTPPTTRSGSGKSLKRPAHLRHFVLDEDLDEPVEKSPRLLVENIMPDNDNLQSAAMEQKINTLMTMMTSMNTDISSTIQSTIDSQMNPIQSSLTALKASVESNTKQMEDMKTNVDATFVSVRKDVAAVQTNVFSMETRMTDMQKVIDQVRRHDPTNQSATAVSQNSGNLSAMLNNLSEPSTSISVPRRREQKIIDLPVFSGDSKDWPNFIAEFDDTTNSEGYSTVQNNSRLKKCLCGKAREVVDSMLIHHNNVPEVIERLRVRFGRPEKIIKTQLDIVKAIPPIADNRIELLIQFADKVNNMKNVLKSCDSEHHLSNPTLLEELVLKLPLSKRWVWAEHQSTITPFATIDHFSSWLNKIADLADIIPVPITHSHSKMYAEKDKKDRGRVLLVNDKEATPTCLKCNEDHKLPDCPEYKTFGVDEKWQFVVAEKLCFLCLEKHKNPRRCRRKACGFEGCKRRHHISLHKNGRSVLNRNAQEFHPNQNDEEVAVEEVYTTQSDNEANVLFKIVPVILYGPLGTKKTFALLDEASTLTMMNRDMADDLGIKGERRLLSIKGIDSKAKVSQAEVIDAKISGTFSHAPIYEMKGVQVIDSLKLPCQTIDVKKMYSQFQGLPIENFENGVPKILIGLKHAFLGAPTNVPLYPGSGPIPIMTKLGYIIYGSKDKYATQEVDGKSHSVLFTNAEPDLVELHNMIEQHYAIEDFGVKAVAQVESVEDKRALAILKKTTERVQGGFQSGLLWRREAVLFPSSYEMAVKRLLAVERKMKRDGNYCKLYHETIDDYIKKGYAKKMTYEESAESTGKTWYLPHFGVINPNKPDKFRLVFDGAAMVKGTSLNSELLVGPDLNQPILKILWRFRERIVGVCGDIREMYHQIKIQDDDKDSQRFVWRDNPHASIEKYQMISMTFGSSSSPTTAQFVKNTNAMEFSQRYPAAAKAIVECHYVDDYVCSYSTEDEAIQTTTDVIYIHKCGGFELRNFISNSALVASTLNGTSNNVGSISMDMSSKIQVVDKVLGLYWNVEEDVFTFEMRFSRIAKDVLSFNRRPTKRELLSIAMSIYDPFGFISNFSIHIKVLVQKVWKKGVSWDEEISDCIYLEWKQWFMELEKVRAVKVPRCYSSSLFQASKIELHTLVDASSVAFCAVCYLRICHSHGVDIALVGSKTKCAPIKELSIPRLELQAAVLGTRLSNTIKESVSFQIDCHFYWSDSMTVLYWLKDEKCRYKQFVRNRISEILDSTSASSWFYVPSVANVADDSTRDVYPPRFDSDSRWLKGPSWLSSEEEWPTQPDQFVKQKDDAELINSSQLENHRVMMSQVSTTALDITTFSDFVKLKRRIGWYLRFMSYLKAKKDKTRCVKGGLLLSELCEAETVLCRDAQKEGFHDVYLALQLKKAPKLDRHLVKLMPYLDDNGVMRVYGRIDNAPTIPVFTKRPVILPKDHHLSMLIVKYFHEAHQHQFDELTICEIRLRFWIVGARTILRKLKTTCSVCILRLATPRQPMMGQLPEDRLTPFVRPFSFTGVDYFGPVQIAIGRRREKRWIALFTCLTVRAVHVEISENLSSDSFILCLRNFLNLRGLPVRLRSDNGSNFVGAKGEMIASKSFFGEAGIQRECSDKGIEWKFNTPSDPAAGGIWERLVQSIKRVLKPLLKDAVPRVETLRSFLLEAANIVNSRPLTHIPLSHEDELPLTPNHFLMGCPNTIQTIGPTDEKLWCLRKQWRISQSLKNHFWSRFIRDFLPTLTRREKWCARVEPLKAGDVVLICDDNVGRGEWRKGIVEQVILAKDGQVRSAFVKTNGSTLKRPASKLAVLDIKAGRSSGHDESTGGGMSSTL